MKKIIISFCCMVILCSCKHYSEQILVSKKTYDSIVALDSARIFQINMLENVCEKHKDTMDVAQAKLRKLLSDKSDTIFVLKYRIQKCLFYSDIVANNPSQAKFFRGWIARASRQ